MRASRICVLTRKSDATGGPASGAGARASRAGSDTGPGATLKGLVPADTALLLGGSAAQVTYQVLSCQQECSVSQAPPSVK